MYASLILAPPLLLFLLLPLENYAILLYFTFVSCLTFFLEQGFKQQEV